MTNDILVGLAAAPVVAALVEVFKPTFNIPVRFIPMATLVMGVAWNVGARAGEITDIPWASAVFLGILSGLSAGGFYSAVQAARGE